jgi:hypothetical protein
MGHQVLLVDDYVADIPIWYIPNSTPTSYQPRWPLYAKYYILVYNARQPHHAIQALVC